MSDAEITRIHRRERALWRRYMSRCARTPLVPVSAMTDRVRGRTLRSLESIVEARREWKAAHDEIEARRALRWGAEAEGIEAQDAAC